DARPRPHVANAAAIAVAAGIAELDRNAQPVAGESRAGVVFACECRSRFDPASPLAEPRHARPLAHAGRGDGGAARLRGVARIPESRPHSRSVGVAPLLSDARALSAGASARESRRHGSTAKARIHAAVALASA